MRYQMTGKDRDGNVCYEVLDREKRAGVFSYRIFPDQRFFIQEIRLSAGCEPDRMFSAVLNFLEYKAAVSRAAPVYVRIHEKNLYAIRQFLEHGYYSIDTEVRTDEGGEESRFVILRNRS